MDCRKWPDISTIFKSVTAEGKRLNKGSRVDVVAGPGSEKVHYTATIVDLQDEARLAYERTGGPLPGDSVWELESHNGSTKIHYKNTYLHTLAKPVETSLAHSMERFLDDLQKAAEDDKN